MDSHPLVSAAAGVAGFAAAVFAVLYAVKGLVIRVRYGSEECLCSPAPFAAEKPAPAPAEKPRSIFVPVAIAALVGFFIGRNKE